MATTTTTKQKATPQAIGGRGKQREKPKQQATVPVK